MEQFTDCGHLLKEISGRTEVVRETMKTKDKRRISSADVARISRQLRKANKEVLDKLPVGRRVTFQYYQPQGWEGFILIHGADGKFLYEGPDSLLGGKLEPEIAFDTIPGERAKFAIHESVRYGEIEKIKKGRHGMVHIWIDEVLQSRVIEHIAALTVKQVTYMGPRNSRRQHP
ncbi:hypothetical protein AB0D66_34510 [Streptomyces sp. NPDC048270]|uniref:hypothetical protein n=1 Tax=Streptomyces sp. NPDC048270 TaxID=3154615 RepID=UPI0033E96314